MWKTLRIAVLDVLLWAGATFAAMWGFGRIMGWN